jgi:hypothetical protein
MALMGNSSQLCLRLQLLIDSLPCFTTLFQGYLPLQTDGFTPKHREMETENQEDLHPKRRITIVYSKGSWHIP